MVKSWSIPFLILLMLGCAAVQIHPGAVNKADSQAYDVLLIAQAVIEQARGEADAGKLPEQIKPALNNLVSAYNIARTSWLTYRAAVKASQPADGSGLSRTMNSLTAALNAFNNSRSVQ